MTASFTENAPKSRLRRVIGKVLAAFMMLLADGALALGKNERIRIGTSPCTLGSDTWIAMGRLNGVADSSFQCVSDLDDECRKGS